MDEEISMAQLARVYIKLRDKIQEINRELEGKIDALKAQQEEISAEMRERLKSQGASSVKTEHGTVMLRVETSYYPQDWDSFAAFIKQEQCLELLQKRVAQGNLQTWMEEHPDKVPPGLGSASQYIVTVRKPNGS